MAGAATAAMATGAAIKFAARVSLAAWVRSFRNSASILIVSPKFFLCSAESERSCERRLSAFTGTIWQMQHMEIPPCENRFGRLIEVVTSDRFGVAVQSAEIPAAQRAGRGHRPENGGSSSLNSRPNLLHYATESGARKQRSVLPAIGSCRASGAIDGAGWQGHAGSAGGTGLDQLAGIGRRG